IFAGQLLAQSICQSSLKPFRFIFGHSSLRLHPANPSRSNNARLFFTQSVYVGAAIPTLAGQEIRLGFVARFSGQLRGAVFFEVRRYLAFSFSVRVGLPDDGNSRSRTI